MSFLDYLTLALFAAWSASEAGLRLISRVNRWRGPTVESDRFSYYGMWFAVMPPVGLALLIRGQLILTNGWGSFGSLTPLLGYLGCGLSGVGLALRLAAVATLRKQFTTTVTIVAQHALVDSGLYGRIRHPAYLGLLTTMLGFGLASGNWLSLAVLVGLPLAARLYRIRVEERALLRHFGPAYQAYASRTKRLLPGIY